jgi:hypothetical protein
VDEIKENMKNIVKPTDPKLTSTTLVIGGLTDFTSLNDASKWLENILWEAYAPLPLEIFVRNAAGAFSGVFCASFVSPEDRIKALAVLKRKLGEIGRKEIWANTDLPTEVRAPEVYLYGLKKQLVEWGFARASVRVEVDGPSKTLKVEGKEVLIIKCEGGEILCEWVETWRVWQDLHESTEMKALADKCTRILSGAGKGTSKGK